MSKNIKYGLVATVIMEEEFYHTKEDDIRSKNIKYDEGYYIFEECMVLSKMII